MVFGSIKQRGTFCKDGPRLREMKVDTNDSYEERTCVRKSAVCQRQRDMRYDTEVMKRKVVRVADRGVRGMATFPSVNA